MVNFVTNNVLGIFKNICDLNKEFNNNTFLYFAYGSNLLKKRIRLKNPSAEFLGSGRLEDHQPNFFTYSERWRGAVATIVPVKNNHVWGAIWRLDNKDIPSLDKQEGVETKWYFPKTVDVITDKGHKVKCRSYQLTINPPVRKEGEELPSDRRPSITYIKCIIDGAIECNLPGSYLSDLKKIPNNDQEAPDMMGWLQKEPKPK